MHAFLARDHPVLDFVATVSERTTTHDDRLRSPEDLASWLAGAGLVEDTVVVTADGLARAVAVREAAFALLAALLDGTPPPADAVDRVVDAAGRRVRLELDADGQLHRRGDLDAVLGELATDCLALHGQDRTLLHWCADAACTRPFLDRSRGGRRRWCGMQGCGDRAKAAAYRQRRRAGAAGG